MRRKEKDYRNSNSKYKPAMMNIADILLVMIVLVAFAMISIFGHQTFSLINDDIQSDADLSTTAKTTSSNLEARYPATLDGAFAIMFVLFWIFLIVSSFLIDSHPIFFIISIILLLGAFVVAMVLSNSYQELMSDSDISSFGDQFPITNFIIGNLLLVVIAIGFSVVIVLYGKNKWSA